MPNYTIEVSSTSPSLTIVMAIHVNRGRRPLDPPLYTVDVRPTVSVGVSLPSGRYLMRFEVQNGSGAFTVAFKDDAGATAASRSFKSPPQGGRSWYFTLA